MFVFCSTTDFIRGGSATTTRVNRRSRAIGARVLVPIGGEVRRVHHSAMQGTCVQCSIFPGASVQSKTLILFLNNRGAVFADGGRVRRLPTNIGALPSCSVSGGSPSDSALSSLVVLFSRGFKKSGPPWPGGAQNCFHLPVIRVFIHSEPLLAIKVALDQSLWLGLHCTWETDCPGFRKAQKTRVKHQNTMKSDP